MTLSNPVPDFSLAVGDRLPVWQQTFVDDSGAEFDLTGWTVILSMQDQGRVNAVIPVAVSVSNTPAGNAALLSVNWGATDTLYAAMYDAEFVATQTSSGKTMTMRREPTLLVEIRPRV